MVEWIAALCVVFAAILCLRRILIRIAPSAFAGREPGRIRVVDSAALSLKQQIHLVEVDGECLLIGASESGLVRLGRHTRKQAATACSEPSVEGRFDGEPAVDAGPTTSRRRLVRVLRAAAGAFGVVVVLLSVVVLGVGEAVAATRAAVETASSAPTLSVSIGGATAPDQISDTLKIVLVLTALSVAPSLLLMTTCFTRILIVLALLRQALGTATLPPNQVLVGLALMTTVYVMSPVGEAVYAQAVEPYMAKKIGGTEAIDAGIAPVREYMLRHARETDLELFLEMRGDSAPEKPEDVAFTALMPAFMISEMRAAFEIGFMIYLPFLVVDLVVASMLISLGMIMLPPVMISLPFKLMLFVLVDGWNLMLTSLVAGLQ